MSLPWGAENTHSAKWDYAYCVRLTTDSAVIHLNLHPAPMQVAVTREQHGAMAEGPHRDMFRFGRRSRITTHDGCCPSYVVCVQNPLPVLTRVILVLSVCILFRVSLFVWHLFGHGIRFFSAAQPAVRKSPVASWVGVARGPCRFRSLSNGVSTASARLCCCNSCCCC